MREIKFGEQTIRVKASALALLYFRQAFGADLIGSLMKFQSIEKDPSQLDSVAILQMIWAMAKAADKEIKPFEAWLESLDVVDIFNPETLAAVMEEAASGFFRGTAVPPGQKGGSK